MSVWARWIPIVMLVLLLAAPAKTLPPTPPPAVLLVTHPSVRVLKTLSLLRHIGLLPREGLAFVGLYHAAEAESYRAARKWLAAADRGLFTLRQLDCPLDAATVFQPNGCTATFQELLATADGLLVTGGPDIPPSLYGEPTALTTTIEAPARHLWELSFLYHLVGRGADAPPIPLLQARPQFPVLAICLGLQTLDVAAGGTLVQDIPSQLYGARSWEDVQASPPVTWHRNPAAALAPSPDVGAGVLHPITVAADSTLAQRLERPAEPVRVLSIHHQAVKALGVGLRAVATSLDGKVVEALEHGSYPLVLGVQFHPEHAALWDPAKKYRATAAATVRNPAVEAMKTDDRMRAFHTGLWRWFTAGVAQSAAHRAGAR